MPVYELFAIAKPLAKQHIASIMKAACQTVLKGGGVLTDIKSFGEQPLAYDMRKPGEKYSQAHMWQLTFAAPTSTLPDLDHLLRVEERMLRWMVLRRRPFAPLPNTYRVARAAQEVAASLDGSAAPLSESQPQ